MLTSASSPTRKEFNYASLDAETSQFVQQQTGEIRVLMKRTAQGIVEIGQKLISVKEKLGHGRFGDWLEAEFDWGKSTANRFMNVALNFPNLEKLENFAPSALYLLSEASTPVGVREEAIARAEAGEPITYTAAKKIKQKYAKPPTKLQVEPEPASQPQMLPAPAPQSGSKLEIVSIRSQSQAKALEEAIRVIVPQAAQMPLAPQPSQPVYAPEQPGVWWRLGGRHLLYLGDSNSREFLRRITEEVQLLLAFPPAPGWQPAIQAVTRIVSAQYLPQGKSLAQLDEFLESAILFHSRLEDLVVSCFLPEPEILSIINRLDRRGLLAEPDYMRFDAVVSDWKRVGLKAERLS